MSNESTYVIVGASLAGATAADSLRELGFDGRIVLIGDEKELPYERPPLSKGYLAGREERAKIYVHDEGWYVEHSVDLLLGRRVTRLERAAHQLELEGGERIRYTKLLLATGASARRLGVPGADLDGVHYLRRVGDSDRLRAAIAAGGRIIVVGGGWIGLEVAAAAREAGVEVTVIEPQSAPLLAAMGDEMGAFFAGLHRRHGVDLQLGLAVTGFEGTTRVTGVRTNDGRVFAADAVVIGIGAIPNVELAASAGLDCADGIVVDESLRTDDADIVAAGDVARAFHPFYGTHLRSEHWANALHGAPVAARSMLGQQATYDRLPYFYTDQYDVGMEFCGRIGSEGYDQLVTRGDVEGAAFQAFWLTAGRVVAGMHVNLWDDGIAPIEELIRGTAKADPERVADPTVPLTADAVAP